MNAHLGQWDELLDVLLEAGDEIGGLLGCEVWIVNTISDDPDAIWVPEVWCSEADHAASLTDERVRVIIARASPLMTGFGERFTLEPVAGKELIDPVQ